MMQFLNDDFLVFVTKLLMTLSPAMQKINSCCSVIQHKEQMIKALTFVKVLKLNFNTTDEFLKGIDYYLIINLPKRT